MRRLLGFIVVAYVTCLGTGCSTMSNTAKGAGIGAGVGALTGAVVGDAAGGKAGKGALIGTGIGAVVGGLIGNEEDQREKAEKDAQVRDAEQRAALASQSPPLTIDDVIQLHRDGTPESVIINQMRSTNSTYLLTTDDIRRLSSGNVPSNIIVEMQNRRPGYTRPVSRVYVPAPPPQPVIIHETRPVYVMPYAPPPPPPPGFGIGVRYAR